MPRDGSFIYGLPFPDVVAGTTIESTVYNGFTNDVKGEFNSARPIVAGGTGATNAPAALLALGAERAYQVVTNYNTHVFVSGSFRSDAAAVGGPVAQLLVGSVLDYTGNSMVIEAVGGDGKKYQRVKSFVDGTWGPWVDLSAGLDARYVNVTGDTMTGILSINGNTPYSISLTQAAPGTPTPNKFMRVDASGNFGIVNSAFTTSILTLNDTGDLTVHDATVARDANHGALFFGSNAAQFLYYDGTTFQFAGGGVNVPSLTVGGSGSFNGNVRSGAGGATGVYYFSSADKYLFYNGTDFVFNGGPVNVPTLVSASNALITGIVNVQNTAGSNYPITIASAVGSGNSAYIQSVCSGVRAWSFGARSDGMFVINDVTGGLNRLAIDTAGNFTFTAGQLRINGDVLAVRNAPSPTTEGLIYFGDQGAGSRYLHYAGGLFNFIGAGVTIGTGNLQLTSGAIFTSNGNIFTTVGDVQTQNGNTLTQKTGLASHTINSVGGTDDARTIYQSGGTPKWIVSSSLDRYFIYNGNTTSGVQLNSQSATSWSAISDIRAKDNIQPLNVLGMLANFRAVRYTLKTTGKTELGIIAQEQVDQFPELINRGTDGALPVLEASDGKDKEKEDRNDKVKKQLAQDTWSASYDRFGVLAMQGVKELLARVVKLEAELATLKAK